MIMSESSSSTENLESGESEFATKADLISIVNSIDDRLEAMMSLLTASLTNNAQAKVQDIQSTPPRLSTPAPDDFSTANSSAEYDPRSLTAALQRLGVKIPASPSTGSENSADNFVSSRPPRASILANGINRDSVISVAHKPYEKMLDSYPTLIKIYVHNQEFERHQIKYKGFDHYLLDSLSHELVNQLVSEYRDFLTHDNIKKKTNEQILGYLYKLPSGDSLPELRAALLIGIDYFYIKHVPINASALNTKDWLNQAVAYIDFFEKYYNIVMEAKPKDLSVQMKGKIKVPGEDKEDTFYDLFFRMFPHKPLGEIIRSHFSNLGKSSSTNKAPTEMAEVFDRARNSILDDKAKLASINYALLAFPSSPNPSRPPSTPASSNPSYSSQYSRGSPHTNRGEDNVRRPFRPGFIPNGARPNNGAFHGPRGQQATLANITSHHHESHMTAEEFLLESVVSQDGSIHNPYAEDPDESRDEGFDADQEPSEDLSLNALVRGQAQQDTSQLPCHSMALSSDKKCANVEAGKTCRYSHSPSLLAQYVKEISSKISKSPYFSASDSR